MDVDSIAIVEVWPRIDDVLQWSHVLMDVDSRRAAVRTRSGRASFNGATS